MYCTVMRCYILGNTEGILMIFGHISLSLSLKTHYLLKVLFLLPDRKLSPNLLKWNVPLNKCPDKDLCWLHSGRLRLWEGGAIYLLLIVQSVLINIQFYLLLLEIKKKKKLSRKLWANFTNTLHQCNLGFKCKKKKCHWYLQSERSDNIACKSKVEGHFCDWPICMHMYFWELLS